VTRRLEDTEDGIDEAGWERAMTRLPRAQVSTEERMRRYAERMAKCRETMKAQQGGGK
jgi:hypothetical protein